jgi:hypothetical protein
MIWQLVKRDPAWRGALILTPIGAVGCSVLPREFIGMFVFVVGMFWFRSQPQQRATLFHAALPIRACDLFLARILALFAGVWLPLASGAALLLFVGKRVEDAATLVEIGAGFSVLVLVAQSSRVREIAGSPRASTISVAVVWIAGYTIWQGQLVPRAVLLTVCALLCAVLFWNIWRQLPPAFEVLPAKLARQASRQGTTAAPVLVWWPILRSLFQLRTLGFLPMIVFMAVGGQRLWVSMFCIFPVLAAMPRLPWALGLPVRRGTLLAVILLPTVMAFLLGVLLGNWFGERPPIRMEWTASHRVPDVRPPLEFWRTGKAPIIESPWGESWQPETVRLRGVAIYNPYSFGPGSSERFCDWQFRRATEAVYGEAIDYAYYKSHRIWVRPLTRQTRLAILNLSACACWIMLMVNLLLTTMHWRVGRISRHGQWVLSALLMAQMALFLLIELAPEHVSTGPISVSLVNVLLLRVSAVLPAGLPAVALAAALPVALLCWTAARLFRGVELPPPAVAKADWA